MNPKLVINSIIKEINKNVDLAEQPFALRSENFKRNYIHFEKGQNFFTVLYDDNDGCVILRWGRDGIEYFDVIDPKSKKLLPGLGQQLKKLNKEAR